MLSHIFKVGVPLRATSVHIRQRPFSSFKSSTTRLSNPLLFQKYNAVALVPSPRIHLLVRGVASQVSGRPGSQTLGHAATNIKEEVGNSTADLAKTIAGGNMYGDSVVPPTKDTFVSLQIYAGSHLRPNPFQLGITNAVAHAVPKPYIVFGLAGGLPYLAASGTTIYLARQAGLAATGLY